ncbi:MAG: hypothetical protein SF162_06360 [bacterium]|nr:hypothetical protein [bacterium]
MMLTDFRARLPLHLAVYGLYLLIALMVTFPLVTHLSTHFAGFADGDVYQAAHQLWRLGLAVPLPAALNLYVLLTLALNGWAMWMLARSLIHAVAPAAHLPALVAGAVYMLYPTMQGHLGAGHIGLIAQWGVPLYTLGLFRLYDSQHSRPLVRIAAAAGLGLVVLLVMGALPGAPLNTPAESDAGEIVRSSADLLAAVTPSYLHPVFGQFAYTRQVLGDNLTEGAGYFGIAAALLSLIAVIRVRAARGWLVVAAVAYLLSLGGLLNVFGQPVRFAFEGYQVYITLPFALAADLPLIDLVRTPGRFNLLTALAAAVLAGYGAAWLSIRLPRLPSAVKGALTLALIAGIAFEYQTFTPFPLAPAAIPPQVRDLAGRAILDLPYDHPVTISYSLYLQTAHERPLIAGQGAGSSTQDPAKLALLQATLDPALLDAVGADVIIVHRAQDDGTLEARARAVLGDPTYADAQLTIFERDGAPPAPAFQTAQGRVNPDEHTAYLYAPASGWTAARLTLPGERDTSLSLNGRVIRTFAPDAGDDAVTLPVWLPAPGFHTLRLHSVDACPQAFDSALRCPPVGTLALETGLRESSAPAPIRFENGIALSAWIVDFPLQRAVQAALRWDFGRPITRNDVRFVHVTDSAGVLILQADRPIGAAAGGTSWQETVSLYRARLPAGEYRVYAGWYRLADDSTLTNYALMDGAPDGSTGNAALIAVLTVGGAAP